MATTLFLVSGGGGVSGYNAAMRPRGLGVVTALVAPTAGGTDIQWTITSGGTPLSFISTPFFAAVTIAGSITVNIWGAEDVATLNCGARMKFFKYTPAAVKTLFATLDQGIELPTTNSALNWSGSPTSTAFSPGDRLVVEPYITNIGTMATGGLCRLRYSGVTGAASGDTFVTLTETVDLSRFMRCQ